MATSDHEKEQRAFWDARCVAIRSNPTVTAGSGEIGKAADGMLTERDKRFPAPEGGER